MTDQDESAPVTGVTGQGWPPPAASTDDLHGADHLRASLAALSQLGTGAAVRAASGRVGVHSVLALPLLTSGNAIGALGLYSHIRDAFDADDAAAAEQFAAPAAVAVQNVLAMAQSQRLAEQPQSALRSRLVIDQAIGVTIRTGATAAEASDQIRQTSRSQRLKTAVIARRIIDDAVHRAYRRRTDENEPAG